MFRVEKITIRLSDNEKKAIRENANRKQICISEYIRNLVPECNGGTTTPPLHQ